MTQYRAKLFLQDHLTSSCFSYETFVTTVLKFLQFLCLIHGNNVAYFTMLGNWEFWENVVLLIINCNLKKYKMAKLEVFKNN